MDNKKVLLIDTDGKLRRELGDGTEMPGFEFVEVVSAAQALHVLAKQTIRIVVLNITQAGQEELDLISYIKVNVSGCEVIVLAGIHEIENAIRAVRHGAYLYLVKPVKSDDLRLVLQKISLRQEKDLKYLESQTRLMHDLLGDDESMRRKIQLADKVALTDSTVLITGESGTGKEIFARYVHMKSKRADGPFVAVNCGALPENLVESELFGHLKGAFTGAAFAKKGLIEEANQGTLFLDEVGELSAQTQVKLLRFLQDHRVRPVGGNEDQVINVRIIAATNKDLGEEVAQGAFREDLFFRINVIHIHLPPLRERRSNIAKLIPFFIIKYATTMDKKPPLIDPHAMALIQNYSFPGNIRELENILERAVVLCEGGTIRPDDLPQNILVNRPLIASHSEGAEEELLSLHDLEKRHIARVLKKLNNNQSAAAKHLGLSRTTLWRKLKEHGISA